MFLEQYFLLRDCRNFELRISLAGSTFIFPNFIAENLLKGHLWIADT